MFIYTFKASSVKFFAVVMFSIFALIVFVSMVPQYSAGDNTVGAFSDSKLKNNEDRVNFLREQGYNVEGSPCEIAEIVVPEHFDSVYQDYNNIQKSQGLNLERYQGKTVTRYTYVVSDYDYDGKVMANLILYNDKVVAGDICSTDGEGFVSSLIG